MASQEMICLDTLCCLEDLTITRPDHHPARPSPGPTITRPDHALD
jgi:hypothetical protein